MRFGRIGYLALLGLVVLMLAACGPEGGAGAEVNPADEALRIAAAYGESGDVNRARIDLQAIEVANPSHWLLFLTERFIAEGQDPGETQALVQLSVGLGLQSRAVTEYARQHNLLQAAPEPTFEVVERSESNVIALQPAPRAAEDEDEAGGAPVVAADAASEDEAESEGGDDAGAPEAVDSQEAEQTGPPVVVEPAPAAPASPMIQASNALNVRGGPGTNYPVVAALQTGAQADIIARNPQADWWQVSVGGQQGWVYGPLVTTSGDTGSVAVAANIPAPPPTPVPAPVAAAPPVQQEAPAAAPEAPQEQPEQQAEPEAPQEEAPQEEAPQEQAPSGGGWTVTTRLRPVGQDAQSCSGGAHDIFVTVVDAAGNPLNGVRVQEVFTNQIKETGGSGPGRTHWNIYRGGGGQVVLLDEGGNPMSPISEGMSADWPAFHMMWDAGYCNCKPHPDAASCEADINNKTYFFAVGHYTYEVTFRRNH